jgi:hypothetical protein
MLKWLKKAQEENVVDLLPYWHQLMEPAGERSGRNGFFSEVIKLTNSASHSLFSVWLPALKYLSVGTKASIFAARHEP